MNSSTKQSEELYTLEEHESHLDSMSEQKRRGLSQLADMLQIYLQPEVPDLMEEMTSLPPSCQDPLSLLAKQGLFSISTILLHHYERDESGVELLMSMHATSPNCSKGP
ncbi:unnamed protein product [Gadus morhua 'NCC']